MTASEPTAVIGMAGLLGQPSIHAHRIDIVMGAVSSGAIMPLTGPPDAPVADCGSGPLVGAARS